MHEYPCKINFARIPGGTAQIPTGEKIGDCNLIVIRLKSAYRRPIVTSDYPVGSQRNERRSKRKGSGTVGVRAS